MKRISHINLLLLSFLVFLVSIFFLLESKKELKTSFKNYNEINLLSTEYKNQKLKWINPKGIDKKLNTIIKRLKLKNITMKKNKNAIDITLKRTSIKQIDKFLNKILNESLIINRLDITKNTLEIQIGYK